jgi:hypothetical protein
MDGVPRLLIGSRSPVPIGCIPFDVPPWQTEQGVQPLVFLAHPRSFISGPYGF